MKASYVMLQTGWRARQARLKFSHDMKRVVLVQAAIRGFLTRMIVENIRREKLEID